MVSLSETFVDHLVLFQREKTAPLAFSSLARSLGDGIQLSDLLSFGHALQAVDPGERAVGVATETRTTTWLSSRDDQHLARRCVQRRLVVTLEAAHVCRRDGVAVRVEFEFGLSFFL